MLRVRVRIVKTERQQSVHRAQSKPSCRVREGGRFEDGSFRSQVRDCIDTKRFDDE